MLSVSIPAPRVHSITTGILTSPAADGGATFAPADADTFLEWAQLQNAQRTVDDDLRNSIAAIRDRIPSRYHVTINAVRGMRFDPDGNAQWHDHYSASASRGSFEIGIGDTVEQALDALLAKLKPVAA